MAAALLAEGEMVELMVVGKVFGREGVSVLTDKRLLVVNENELQPFVQEFEVAEPLSVQGWEEGRTASLIFTEGETLTRMDAIVDTALAKEMAGRIRARTGTPTA